MKLETRNSQIEFELRGKDGPKPGTVVGYAAVFDKLSHDLGGFKERILPGAFDDAITDETHALYNHDTGAVLGSTKSGTLSLNTDSIGLKFEIDMPDTTVGRDLWTSLGRNDISGASFGFTIESDDWASLDGIMIRTISQIRHLYEVTITPMPAYPDTSVATASLRSFQTQDDALHRHIEAERRVRAMRMHRV